MNIKERRKIIYWLAGAISAMMFWRMIPSSTEKKSKTVKMLTEDGQLVEVDEKFLVGDHQRLKPDEYHSWVKRKK